MINLIILKTIFALSSIFSVEINNCALIKNSSNCLPEFYSSSDSSFASGVADLSIKNNIIEPNDSDLEYGPNYLDTVSMNYYQQTSFNMTNYFECLYDYSPVNNIGSCGYVSLIQAMSYYDTFFNDDIIPEIYDRAYGDALTEEEAKHYSPGTLRLAYNGSGYNSYYEFCHATQNFCLQSRLTVIRNVLDYTDNINNFSYSVGADSYDRILNEFSPDSVNVTIHQNLLTQTHYIILIKSIIDSGNPAIVHIKKYNPGGNDYLHSVVAYDYDENGIYANFGWGPNDTHSLLLGGTAAYDEIYMVAQLDYSNLGHDHSNNYKIGDLNLCGCNLRDFVYCKNATLWADVPPTLYWMKNQYDSSETYILIFVDHLGQTILQLPVDYNQVTLSYNVWNTIVSNSGSSIIIYLKRVSNTTTYWPDTVSIFNNPLSSLSVLTIHPTDYGFGDSYPTDYATSTYYHRHFLSNGFSFRTRRYRTGYIHNEYVVMSCVKTNITEAFIEYAFDEPIYKIEVDLSHWREYACEWLDKDSGVAVLQTWHQRNPLDLFDYDRWVTELDLLSDNTNLPRNRNYPTTYEITFSSPVYSFRFYSKINEARTSDWNRGRICIGDMKLYLGAAN